MWTECIYNITVLIYIVVYWRNLIRYTNVLPHNEMASVKFVMRVFPFIRKEQCGSHSKDFHEIWHLRIFRKFVEKIKVSLKSSKNNRYLTRRPIHIFLSYLVDFFLEWEIFQNNVVEKLKTHILCSVTFFFKSCSLWDVENIAERGRAQKTTWRMRIACWISGGYKYTLLGRVIIIAFPEQQWLHERASLLRYTCVACIVYNNILMNVSTKQE